MSNDTSSLKSIAKRTNLKKMKKALILSEEKMSVAEREWRKNNKL